MWVRVKKKMKLVQQICEFAFDEESEASGSLPLGTQGYPRRFEHSFVTVVAVR